MKSRTNHRVAENTEKTSTERIRRLASIKLNRKAFPFLCAFVFSVFSVFSVTLWLFGFLFSVLDGTHNDTSYPHCLSPRSPLAAPAAAQKKPQKEEFEKAVDRALEYLQNEQNSMVPGAGCAVRWGQQRSGGDVVVRHGFSSGHVPGEGPYGANVQKGIEYVLGCRQRNGLITGFNFGNFEMYQHGICTLMLAEAVGMLPDRRQAKKLRERLELAVTVILNGAGQG